MVMIFSSEPARNFLLKEGRVFSFRSRKRKRTGRDWITDRRGGKKIADVYIEEPFEIWKAKQLETFVHASGFENLDAWLKEIYRLGGFNDGSEFRKCGNCGLILTFEKIGNRRKTK